MYLNYKGVNTYYTDSGKGSAVVLLHGFLESSTMWNPFIASLSKKNRVITIDLLGHGKTGCLGYVHSMELMAETVEAVLKHLEIEQSIFIGHSMGGYVALAFAEKHPNTINGLCLMNSTALNDTAEKKKNRDRAIIAVKQNHNIFIRLAIANLFSPKNRTSLSEDIKTVIQEAQKTPLQGIVAALEGMKVRKNRMNLLQNTAYKKLIILGKNDPVLNADHLVAQLKNTPIECIEFPDGHMSHIENKDKFLHSIVYFIEKL